MSPCERCCSACALHVCVCPHAFMLACVLARPLFQRAQGPNTLPYQPSIAPGTHKGTGRIKTKAIIKIRIRARARIEANSISIPSCLPVDTFLTHSHPYASCDSRARRPLTRSSPSLLHLHSDPAFLRIGLTSSPQYGRHTSNPSSPHLLAPVLSRPSLSLSLFLS